MNRLRHESDPALDPATSGMAQAPAPTPTVAADLRSVAGARDSAAKAAAEAAAGAAEAAGVDMVELHGIEQLEAMTRLFDEIWGIREGSLMPLGVSRAVEHAGNYIAGAFDSRGGELVGAIIGFFGLRDGQLLMHSHIAGVHPRAQGRAIGFALKQHQRAWALAAGVRTIEWTFDPLVRRNTFFNVTKLGVEVVAYHADFYGRMDDALNAGDPSDRCVARWDLASPAVIAAAAGNAVEVDRAALLAGGARVVLAGGAGGAPEARPSGRGGTRLAWVPADVVALRAAQPVLARAWRLALRATLREAIEQGYALTGVTRDGWYVLTEPRERAEPAQGQPV
jgi:predicted GNAT superfamily acetyltransferase